MDLTVVIPTHNRSSALDLTLVKLSEQIFSGTWELIVVNNNSTDDTEQVVSEWQHKFPVELKLIRETKPGAAAARNAGAAMAVGEYLVFLDNDIHVAPDFLSRHLNSLEKYRGSWIFGSTVNSSEFESTPFALYRRSLGLERPNQNSDTDLGGLSAANLSLPRADFNRLGGFDTNFFVASGEDRDLGMRAVSDGIRLVFDPLIIGIHQDWAGSTIRDFCLRQRMYAQTEPYFWRKYGDRAPRLELVNANLPANLRHDGLRSFIRKKIKQAIGSDLGQWFIIGCCEVTEQVFPIKRITWPLYRMAIAGALNRGFREGLERLGGVKSIGI